jgi:hypothetical protein
MNDEIRKELEAVLAAAGIHDARKGVVTRQAPAEAAYQFIRKHAPAILKLLEQPAQEPVAWIKHGPYDDDEPVVCVYQNPHNDDFYTPLYAAPQPAQASVPDGTK